MGLEMTRCDHCGQVFDNDELVVMERDFISESDDQWHISPATCLECRRVVRQERTDMSGDYSPLHPDETQQEFEEHEDHEPRYS